MPGSRWNARKHACTSSELLLPDENAAELDELLEGLHEQYRPETALHIQFVIDAARAIWLLKRNNQRYDEYEQALYKQEPDSTKDRKSTRLNSSHVEIPYAVLCL